MGDQPYEADSACATVVAVTRAATAQCLVCRLQVAQVAGGVTPGSGQGTGGRAGAKSLLADRAPGPAGGFMSLGMVGSAIVLVAVPFV